MTSLKSQGVVFSALAWAVTTAQLIWPWSESRLELLVLAAVIFLLGLPHGALDTIFARQLYGIQTVRGWVRFGFFYLCLSGFALGAWFLTPTLFLWVFLALSAAHFSGDPDGETSGLCRLFYGGAIIVLPTLLHADEVTRLFAFLVDAASARNIAAALHEASLWWLAALLVAAAFSAKADWSKALEFVSLAALATLVPPLMAFAVFFCCMHSPRHMLRTQVFAGITSFRRLLKAAAIPTLLVLGGAVLVFCFAGNQPVEGLVVRLLFVTLAALTFPHMFLVEQVRLSGWIRASRYRSAELAPARPR